MRIFQNQTQKKHLNILNVKVLIVQTKRSLSDILTDGCLVNRCVNTFHIPYKSQ